MKNQIKKKDAKFISKEEILKGIDVGLKQIQKRKWSGKKAKTLQTLIEEL